MDSKTIVMIAAILILVVALGYVGYTTSNTTHDMSDQIGQLGNDKAALENSLAKERTDVGNLIDVFNVREGGDAVYFNVEMIGPKSFYISLVAPSWVTANDTYEVTSITYGDLSRRNVTEISKTEKICSFSGKIIGAVQMQIPMICKIADTVSSGEDALKSEFVEGDAGMVCLSMRYNDGPSNWLCRTFLVKY